MNPVNDTVLILAAVFSASLLLLLQAGLALTEAGLCRARNAANIMLRAFSNIGVGGLVFWVAGFALMFGASNGVVGTTHFLLNPTGPDSSREFALWMQQALCAVTAASIVFGATAERMRFGAAVGVSAAMAGIIYPVAGHWIWGNLLIAGNTAGGSWLAARGFVDFGGSAVIHCTGGFAALAASMAVGPRLGKFSRDGSARLIAGHNLTLASLGVMIVFFCWFGFTTVSAVLTPGVSAGRVAMNVLLAGCAGAAASLLVNWLRFGKPDITMSLNGALAGLVAISAGCASVYPLMAMCIGVAAGAIVVFSVVLLDQARLDDPAGAISIHGVCGAFGTFAAGALHEAAFDGRGWNVFEHIATQVVGIGAVLLWGFGLTFALLKAVDLVAGVRPSAEDEIAGLDLTEHGAQAYGDSLNYFAGGAAARVEGATRRNFMSQTREEPTLSPVTLPAELRANRTLPMEP